MGIQFEGTFCLIMENQCLIFLFRRVVCSMFFLDLFGCIRRRSLWMGFRFSSLFSYFWVPIFRLFFDLAELNCLLCLVECESDGSYATTHIGTGLYMRHYLFSGRYLVCRLAMYTRLCVYSCYAAQIRPASGSMYRTN
jgi:hypothetical protein